MEVETPAAYADESLWSDREVTAWLAESEGRTRKLLGLKQIRRAAVSAPSAVPSSSIATPERKKARQRSASPVRADVVSVADSRSLSRRKGQSLSEGMPPCVGALDAYGKASGRAVAAATPYDAPRSGVPVLVRDADSEQPALPFFHQGAVPKGEGRRAHVSPP